MSETTDGRFHGWAMAMDRWHDETGTFHLVTKRGPAVIACGARTYHHGGVESPPATIPTRGHACKRCVRVLNATRAG